MMLYYGAWPGHDRGHDLYDPDGHSLNFTDYTRSKIPLPSKHLLDGQLIPRPMSSPIGAVYESVLWGAWRVFAMCDQSGDSRPGSVSVFLCDNHDGGSGYCMEQFRSVFPKVFARMDAAGMKPYLVDWEADGA